jgi:hypothetical protein
MTRPPHSDGGSSQLRPVVWICAASVAVSLALRVVYLMQPWRIDASMPRAFIAGEAVLGVMARHILRGARPILAYGQYLTGTFEEYIEAAVFAVLGESFTTFRLVPTAFAISWIPLTGAIAARLYGKRAGLLAAALIALPSQFAFEWGFVAWGGHAYVALLLLALYLFLTLLERPSPWRLALMGLALGVASWTYQLTIPFAVVFAGAVLLWLRLGRRQLAVLLIAGSLGAAPLLYANVVQPLGTVRNMAARVRASGRLGRRLAQRPDTDEKFYRSVPIFQVLGAQPRHDGKWSLAGALAALLLVLAGGTAVRRVYASRKADPLAFHGSLLVVACAGLSVLIGLPGFFGQPVARFSLPLYPLLCALAAGGFDWLPRLGVPLVGLILLGNAVQLVVPIRPEPRTPNRQIIEALLAKGLHFGYGGDNMYDIVFESHEAVVIEPLEWTRYRPYRKAVAAADHVFYLYRTDQVDKESYAVLREYLKAHGVSYEEMSVGEYRVLYNLTPPSSIAQGLDRIREEIRRRKGGAGS